MIDHENPKVLIVEDEEPLRRLLRVCFIAHGYRLAEAETGQDGLKQVAHDHPDLILLDLGLPDIDGLSII